MFEPKIIGFLCTWCSYTGADTAGIARLKYPANLRAVRVPCSGRVSPELVMRAFDQGADGVLVLGCHIGECHYDNGNHRTAKRLPVLLALMSFAGLEPERLRLDWVSASEGERFARIVNEFTEAVRQLGPVHWQVAGRESGRLEGRKQGNLDGLQSPVSGLHSPVTSPPPPIRNQQSEFDNRYTQTIREQARQLLESGQVGVVIGYEQGPRGRTRPAFVRQPEEVGRLVWNADCTHNLAVYLPEKLDPGKPGAARPRAALVAKACDSRAIQMQLAENQYSREQVYVLGVACDGINSRTGKHAGLQPRCQHCPDRTPVIYDTLIGEPYRLPVGTASGDDRIDYLHGMQPAERLEFWLSQFDRCLRCYACRQACPMCNCPTCLYERDDSLWLGMGIGINEKRSFHLGRAYHLAGRCIGCDECERACPVGLPISLLNRMLAVEVERLFSYRAGFAPTPSPLATILNGEGG
jgi:coenzyme F420-reducing hydrogenase delta subunit/ferredoxin